MIILFAHQKGGVGKSTLAINYAYANQCAIIDLDSQHSSVLFNQLRTLNKRETIECLTPTNIAEIESVLSIYKGRTDNLIVIDSGGYDSQINRFILAKADLIITPVGISQIEIFGLQKFRNILKEASDILGRLISTCVLINNVDSRSQKRIEELKLYIKNNPQYLNLLDTVIHSRNDFKVAYEHGLTVLELKPHSKASKEMQLLITEINSLIQFKTYK
ncbi:ParA family protein [Athalassotoga saccharophila]|uniref:CobQ/CobB/MinD/ParA nucleotide binding domain-containing protein n=1 Tax=Athalassotoga saccharophila TaxID=1441386 RepID=A0A6N4TE88_9BACT|nr:ParA family protein [Athalassotoga saccharophila]BBJ29093.1 hypothetical protein ATHSA_p20003 [Athalassotoga saccharophila]